MVRTNNGLELRWGERTYIMGIVNVTPDSFSGDGRENAKDAIELGRRQVEAGADLLDVGGESTRPGHQTISEQTEIGRVVPVLRELRKTLAGVPISIDSYKPAVVRAAREAGADIVNSVWGGPPELVEVAAELEMPIVMMHNKVDTHYDEPVADAVLRHLEQEALRAVERGIARERVILDPGIGFGKTADQNLEVLASLPRLVALGFPTMIGTSRKSTIGKLTGKEPGDRVYGTVATTALAIAAGIDMVRVHDVAATRDAVAVADAIVRGWRPVQWTR